MSKHMLQKNHFFFHQEFQSESNELVGLVAVHVPPLRHGCEAHGLIKIAQVGPVYCGGH
jgi:hypothetical protein